MSENLTTEIMEKATEELNYLKDNIVTKNQEDIKLPDAGTGEAEWRHVFEPAKEGEKLPEGIWIPNRRERRIMKKRGNKAEKAMAKFYQNAIDDAREYVNTPNYKNEIYKALYEKVKIRNEELEKEIEKNGISAVEGN